MCEIVESEFGIIEEQSSIVFRKLSQIETTELEDVWWIEWLWLNVYDWWLYIIDILV